MHLRWICLCRTLLGLGVCVCLFFFSIEKLM